MVSGTQPPQRPDGDTPRDPWVGRRLGEKGPDGLGRYEVGRRLGRGGWATVYLAHDHALDRDVALKVPHGDLVDDESKRAAFEREVRKLKRVEHPNVVPVHDLVADERGWPVAVLGFMRGGSLADRLERAPGHVQSLEEVLAWLGPVADALDHLHRDVQLVHADVKPENILFDGAGKPRLSDFGIVVSVVPGHSSVLAKTASSAGTPTYMAPELLGAGPASEGRGRTTPSPATDQSALAATVYRALSGVAPYDEPDTDDPLVYLAKWIGALQAGPPRPLDAVAAHAGRAVSDVVMRGLAREPSARHATCSALADALREAVRTPAGARAVPSEATVRIDARPPAPDAGPVAPVGGERAPAGASRANASGGAGAGAASRGPSRWRGVLVALLVLAAAGAGFLAWSNRGREGVPGDAPPGGTTARERERPPETPRAPTATLSLAITSPAKGALLAANPVHVEGTVSGAAGVKVTVNGTDATVTGERYEADVVAATDGALPLAVRASAPDAAPVTATRSVTVDTTAPVVRVVSPERGEATLASDVESVEVRVSASDPHLASVTVDGQPADAQRDGTYVATVRLAAGETRTVSVIATDAAKHASAPVAVRLRREAPKPPPPPAWRADLDAAIAAALDGKLREAAVSWDAAVSKGMDAATAPAGLRRQIEAWKAPPELEVKTPTEGATTAEATVRVTGTLVAGRATDEVYVNGELVRTGPGAFDAPAQVTEDPFTVRVEVKDGGVVRGAAIERHGRREDAPWRAFLSGWAEPVGTEFDAATKYPKRVRRTADGMEMVLIPAGTFPMGAVPGDTGAFESESPRHSVTLTRAYYVDEHEVTVGMWQAYARATGATMPTLRSVATDAHPMHRVSWDDVQGYLRWAQVALPTEAQWERAARGGKDDFVYPWGATDDAKRRNGGEDEDGLSGLAPVRSYGANGYGLYDMSGNVYEWCADWYDLAYYGRSASTDPPGPGSGSSRVVRGGSWLNDARGLRASFRYDAAPSGAFDVVGFRCARSVAAAAPPAPSEAGETLPTDPRTDEPRRAFLSGWAEPVGTDVDPATKYPKRVRRTADGMEMVLIPAGTFPMGAVPGDTGALNNEKPRHSVTLTRAYYVDEHEVTVGMWRAYARATGKTMPELRSEATDAHPMHRVSWEDVQGYLRWAKVALPTEAQWERAARGGKADFVYPWGATDDEKKRNGDGASDGYDGLAPVKSYPANGYGLYDVSGNVWEWCADWYDSSYYGRSPPTDPSGPESGSSRVVRGGSWNVIARYLRPSYRNSFAPTLALGLLGFRCARSLPAPGGG